jgi:hypothetical protein
MWAWRIYNYPIRPAGRRNSFSELPNASSIRHGFFGTPAEDSQNYHWSFAGIEWRTKPYQKTFARRIDLHPGRVFNGFDGNKKGRETREESSRRAQEEGRLQTQSRLLMAASRRAAALPGCRRLPKNCALAPTCRMRRKHRRSSAWR